MYRMEGFYPQSFYFRDTKNFLILPVDSIDPSNTTCICNWVQNGVICYPAKVARIYSPIVPQARKAPNKTPVGPPSLGARASWGQLRMSPDPTQDLGIVSCAPTSQPSALWYWGSHGAAAAFSVSESYSPLPLSHHLEEKKIKIP